MKKRLSCWIAVGTLVLGIGIAAAARRVAINEVAWAGVEGDAAAEWIELVNLTDAAIDLEGWRLTSSDGAPDILLRGILSPPNRDDPSAGYFLLVRRGANLPGLLPDLAYTGALNDRGETLFLYDAAGGLVDTANRSASPGDPPRWPAGTDRFGHPPFCTMERIDPRAADDRSNWTNGAPPADPADGAPAVPGTPKRENRAFNIAPRIGFTVTPPTPRPGEPARFDASASVDPNDQIVSFSWTFGDGEAGSGQTPSHTYADAGTYIVTLVVRDAKGGVSRLAEEVTVADSTPPVADFSVLSPGGRRTIRTGDPLEFRDESTDADGPIVDWRWTFGDGSEASGDRVLHAYPRAGEYLVTLTVRDKQGDTAVQTGSLTILNRPPTARFDRTPRVAEVGRPIRFDASGASDPDGSIVEYRWDFDGDRSADLVAEAPVAEWTFDLPGPAKVSLVVVDDAGDPSLPELREFRVNAPPIAQFRVSDFEPAEMEPVRFVDCSHDPDGSIVAWEWAFGDGSRSEDASPEVAYRTAGTYSVRLTVTDDDGATASAAAEVRVGNLAPIGRLSVHPSEQPTGSPFAFSAAASSDPSPGGSIVRYLWDVTGDGTIDYETDSPSITHAYEAPGEYPAIVHVVDDCGASAAAPPVTLTVRNRPPAVRWVTWEPTAPTDAEQIEFRADASDPDGQIIGWEWVFGDGSGSADERPVHRFPDAGTYSVRIVVRDDRGAPSSAFTVDVGVGNAPPIARFDASAPTPCDGGYAVRFDASSSYDPSPTGRIIHFAWEFGDGASCPGSAGGCTPDRVSPVHCYRASGTYVVTLIVIDDDGALGRTQGSVRIP